MHPTRYVLRPRSGSWSTHPAAHSSDYRLLRFDMTVEHHGKPLGGNNVQLVVGAPDEPRVGLDADVALWLESGWWVSLRNQFADAPSVAAEILKSVGEALSRITSEATDARGLDAEAVTRRVFSTTYDATGLDYW